ncbi:hypothetical protein GCM10022226_51940 [Sphaerisporangium flaviroseum]|uniref:Uncharacterized protein n=1 Tax=Sphaerisporangium flaviroseum TaxID=509199 RepID=A0ABP7IRN8_9ACTN
MHVIISPYTPARAPLSGTGGPQPRGANVPPPPGGGSPDRKKLSDPVVRVAATSQRWPVPAAVDRNLNMRDLLWPTA